MRLRACVFVRLFVCGAGRVQSTDMCVAQAECNRLIQRATPVQVKPEVSKECRCHMARVFESRARARTRQPR